MRIRSQSGNSFEWTKIDRRQGAWRPVFIDDQAGVDQPSGALTCNTELSEASMTEAHAEPKPSDTITVIEGFDAMRIFLATVWQRQGKASEDLALILGAARLADGSPVDPAIWHD